MVLVPTFPLPPTTTTRMGGGYPRRAGAKAGLLATTGRVRRGEPGKS
jgi:hypothetical protein